LIKLIAACFKWVEVGILQTSQMSEWSEV